MEKRFEIQNSQYTFPYHWIQYGDYKNFNLFAKVFSAGRFWYKSATDEIVKIILGMSPKSVLDVGCGDGRLLALIDDAFKENEIDADLYGADLSKEAINFAYAFKPYLTWVVGDFREIDKLFQCITCIEVLEHIPDEEVRRFISGLCDKLENNGELIISVPTVCKPVAPKHYRHYTIEVIKEEFKHVEELELVEYSYMNKNTTMTKIYYKIFCESNSCRIKMLEKLFYKYYLKNCLYGKSEKDCLRLVARFVKRHEKNINTSS